MSKRIAILNEDLNLVSGGRRVAVNLANMFSIENTVFCINFYKRECSYKLNRNIKIIDILRYPHRYVIDIILISGELHSYIKKNQIEYLFSIGRSMSLVALIAVLFTKCKLVVCEQSSLYGYERMMNYTWKLRIVNKIVNPIILIIIP